MAANETAGPVIKGPRRSNGRNAIAPDAYAPSDRRLRQAQRANYRVSVAAAAKTGASSLGMTRQAEYVNPENGLSLL
jgi:hypothetical protein